MSDTAIVSSAAAFIALVAAAIAFGQWRTARWKLSADLHPVRYKAYKEMLAAFEGWYRQGDITPEMHEAIISSLASARYLFGPQIRAKIDHTIAVTHRIVDRESRQDRHTNELVDIHISELYEQLFNFYTSEDLFLPYLRIDHKNPGRIF